MKTVSGELETICDKSVTNDKCGPSSSDNERSIEIDSERVRVRELQHREQRLRAR